MSRRSQQSHQWTSTFLMVQLQHHPHMSRLSQQKNHRGTSTIWMIQPLHHRNHHSHCPTRSPLQPLVDRTQLGAIDEADGLWYCKACWEALLNQPAEMLDRPTSDSAVPESSGSTAS